MPLDTRSPSELRKMFGTNLRELAKGFVSISELTRQLGINRTQFNRYLAGESFPRPDVLARICAFMGVDARVLLEPLDQIEVSQRSPADDYLSGYLGLGKTPVSQDLFPNGFYSFSRESFAEPGRFVIGFVRVFRLDGTAIMRGFENKDAMQMQGLPPTAAAREYRGLINKQEGGIAILAARQNTMTTSFNYLQRVASFENNFWLGYATRTVPESQDGLRATRLVYEHLPATTERTMQAARSTGFCTIEELPAYHRRLLRPGTPFS